MNKIIAFLLFVTLSFFSNKSFGQSGNDFKNLICKEWKLISYEESGEKFPPAPEQKNNRMIFYSDFKAKSIEPGKIQNGVWKYNQTNKTLTVTDTQTKQDANLKVIKLTNTECVLEFKDPDGIALKMYMAPVANKTTPTIIKK